MLVFTASPATYISVTLRNRMNLFEMSEISWLHARARARAHTHTHTHTHTHLYFSKERPELRGVQQWLCFPDKFNAKETPILPKGSHLPAWMDSLGLCLFPVMILLGVWGFKHAKAS